MTIATSSKTGVFGFRQVIFDFDGVVLDSAGMKTRAFAEVYAGEAAEDVARVTRYQEAHGGIGRRDKFAHFEREIFARPAPPERIDALCARFAEIVDAGMRTASYIPGARAFIERAAKLARLHVVTGMPEDDVIRVCEERGIIRYFDRIIGTPTLKPAAFRKILQFGIAPPRETLAIGDSTTEYEAALATHVPFLAVVPPGVMSRFPADVPTISDFADLDRLTRTLLHLVAQR